MGGPLQHSCSFNGRDVWLEHCWLIMYWKHGPKEIFYRNRTKTRLNLCHGSTAAWVSCCWTKGKESVRDLEYSLPSYLLSSMGTCISEAFVPPEAGWPQHCRGSGQQVPCWRMTKASPRMQGNMLVCPPAFLQNASVVWGQLSPSWGIASISYYLL